MIYTKTIITGIKNININRYICDLMSETIKRVMEDPTDTLFLAFMDIGSKGFWDMELYVDIPLCEEGTRYYKVLCDKIAKCMFGIIDAESDFLNILVELAALGHYYDIHPLPNAIFIVHE